MEMKNEKRKSKAKTVRSGRLVAGSSEAGSVMGGSVIGQRRDSGLVISVGWGGGRTQCVFGVAGAGVSLGRLWQLQVASPPAYGGSFGCSHPLPEGAERAGSDDQDAAGASNDRTERMGGVGEKEAGGFGSSGGVAPSPPKGSSDGTS